MFTIIYLCCHRGPNSLTWQSKASKIESEYNSFPGLPSFNLTNLGCETEHCYKMTFAYTYVFEIWLKVCQKICLHREYMNFCIVHSITIFNCCSMN